MRGEDRRAGCPPDGRRQDAVATRAAATPGSGALGATGPAMGDGRDFLDFPEITCSIDFQG